MWYLKACRSCLTTSGNFEKIGPQARRLFNVITGLQLEEGDGFPQYFCAECYVHIKKALAFRRKSRRAHFVLKEIHTIKKQVAQSDVEKVDRIKTNLVSPYTCWKPEETVYSYITPDAIETPQEIPPKEITPDIEAALKESLDQPTFDIQCNAEAKTINIEIKPNEQNDVNVDKKVTVDGEKPIVGELIKLQLKTLHTSSIIVDIKPANWREIEREEEERKKREREAEIEAALQEIHGDGGISDDGGADNDDLPVVPEDIDMEDIFKGLKEESEKESESEPEPEFDIILPQKNPKKEMTYKRKRKISDSQNEQPVVKLPWFLKNKPLSVIHEILANTKITLMTPDEQRDVFTALLNNSPFKQALFKCGICLTFYSSVEELCGHVVYHNEKVKFKHVCKICKDRFETEELLEEHCSLLHWYKYGCSICKGIHYTLKSLVKCNEKLTRLDWLLKRQYIIRPLSQKQMYKPIEGWSGDKRDKFSCGSCKIYFHKQSEYQLHLTRHKPIPPDSLKGYMQCDICHLTFLTYASCETHMEHWHMYSYKCKQCNKRLPNRLQAKAHMTQKHNAHLCYICNEEFTTKNKLMKHSSKAHCVSCNMCTHTADDKPKLMAHQLSTHGYIRLNTAPELNDKRFHCQKCQIYFTNERILYHHLVTIKHPEAKTYKNGCVRCKVLFNSKEELDSHECALGTSDTKYPRKCPDCDEVCTTVWRYRAHIARFHSDKPVISEQEMRLCETCGKVVSYQYYWQHKSKHNDADKPVASDIRIPCRYCPMKSTTTTQHVCHILFNHTAKPYCCTECGLRYLYRSNCRDHILKTHAPVLPYACDVCARSFAHLDFLHEHCSKAHGVPLKKIDKSVFLSKRMFGKVYTYPHMKIDGSLIDLSILERTPVEICDYMDENNEIIDYKEAFFFDQDVDPSMPTKEQPPPKKNRKKTPEQNSIIYERKKEKRRKARGANTPIIKEVDEKKENITDDQAVQVKGENTVNVTNTGVIETEDANITENENMETEDANITESDNIETEDVMGQLIEKDGEYFVLVDGVLYSLEDEAVENLKAGATGETQTLILQ